MAAHSLETRTARDAPPLYAVEDRRYSGEWRVVAEYADPEVAQRVATMLRAAGSAVRVEVIPAPIIP